MMSKIKKLSIWLFLPVILAFVIFAGCGKPKLATPTGLNIDGIELTLNWNAVPDAAFYTIRIQGNGETTEADSGKNSYTLERLSAGEYTFSVKAVSGSNVDFSDSSWSDTVTFVREAETGLTFTLTDSNTAFEVTGIGTASGDIVIPDTYRGLPVTKIADSAFYNKNMLTSVMLGKYVTEIGSQAFANSSYLKSVNLPEGLTSIGEKAFQSCRAIETAIVIPDSVTSIGAQAFEYCNKMPSVTIGKGIATIHENAFNGCSSLTSVTIPDNVETIEKGAFSACSSLKTLNMGSGVKTIGVDAFRRCTSLVSFTTGTNVESLGDYAFAECTALESATLGDSLKTIGVQAFYGCTKLADVSLGEGLEKISDEAFKSTALWSDAQANYLDGWFLGTEAEKAPKIAENTVGIADYAFAACTDYSGFEEFVVEIPESVKYIGEGAFKDSSELYGVVLGRGVLSVGDSAFENSGVSLVVLGTLDENAEGRLGESSLRSIGENAFKGCASLSDIAIPDTVEKIGMYAFENSAIWENAKADKVVYAGNWLVGFIDDGSVGSVNVREGTAGIAEYAFYNQQKLTGITIANSVKYIGRSAFYQCTGMTYVTLPENLTAIEDYTFYHCDSLELPELPSTITKIGRSAFYRCALGSDSSDTDSDQLVIPDSVTEIGDYAFYDCGFTYEDPNQTEESGLLVKNSGIDAIVIGNGVKSIGYQAFAGMDSLKSVILGDSVEVVGERAFYKCQSLVEVTFGNKVKTIGNRAFYSCSSLEEVNLPASVESIGDYAFYKCTSLKEASLGSASTIGNYAFFGCTALASVDVPATVTAIGSQAFRNCSALTSIFLGENIRTIGSHAFYGCKALTIYSGATSLPEGFNSRWNSSYRPVVWGTDYENGYIVSVTITESGVSNANFSYKLSAPVRDGYTFGGWATSKDGQASLDLDGLTSAAAGTTLYAVWTAD